MKTTYKAIIICISVAFAMMTSVVLACQKGQAISKPASAYDNFKNVCNNCLGYGDNLVTNDSGRNQPNMVEYNLPIPEAGNYKLYIAYAAGESRPSQLFINDDPQGEILSDITGGWVRPNMRYIYQGTYRFNAGANKLTIKRASYFPHLYEINLSCDD